MPKDKFQILSSDGILKHHKLKPNEIYNFSLVDHILASEEIKKNLLDENEELLEFPFSLSGEIIIKKLFNNQTTWKEAIQIIYKMNINFFTNCVKCLVPFEQDITINEKTIFISEQLQNDQEFQDADTFFIEEDEHNLYFYNHSPLNIMESLLETIHLATDPRPIHDPACKGLCGSCGTNLNTHTCHCTD